MATLGELKARIAREANREDLLDAPSSSDPTAVSTDTLDLVISRSIEYYAESRFFFNEDRKTNTTTASNEYVNLPDGFRILDQLSVTVGGNRYPLRMQPYEVIETWLGYAVTAGQPTDFSISEGQARLYPLPNIAYTLTWLGIFDVAPALDYADDSSTNSWTTHGEDLIAARSVYLLCRDYFRDPDRAALASGAEKEALDNLKGNTARRVGTGRFRPSW